MMPASKMLAGAIGLALIAASGAASADQFNYMLYAGLEHSDNVALSATNPVSQNVLIPGINFSYVQQGSTVQANVLGTLEYRDYLGNAFSNQTLAQLSGQVNWTVLPQRLDFTVQDYAGVQPLSTFASNAPNNQQQTNVLTLGPTLHFRLGDTVLGQAELRYINSDASETKQFNSSRGEAALRLFKDLSSTAQVSLNLESQSVDFQDSTAPAPYFNGDPIAGLQGTYNNPNQQAARPHRGCFAGLVADRFPRCAQRVDAAGKHHAELAGHAEQPFQRNRRASIFRRSARHDPARSRSGRLWHRCGNHQYAGYTARHQHRQFDHRFAGLPGPTR
jgi:hypothetical protein